MIATRSIVDLIGRTPLIRLNRLSDQTGCEILGKAEFLNPGGSIKDRAALSIVQGARASGALRPGGVIVEGTAGNTGIGLALVGAALGHPVVVVMPRTQSEEKKQAVRSLGARLIEVDAAPFSSPNHFVHYSGRLAAELDESEAAGAIWANQFDNTANRQAHLETTGPEIWDQTGGLWFGGKLVGKVGAVFTSTATQHGGQLADAQPVQQQLLGLVAALALGFTPLVFILAGALLMLVAGRGRRGPGPPRPGRARGPPSSPSWA